MGRFKSLIRSMRVGRADAAGRAELLERAARMAPEWGAIEVRRPVDATNAGPYLGAPTQ